ncbi:MOSC domain-containing protein [Maribacter sp. 2304DJ31-5]|uniref:MOSC domain-containing protein n=1 Tax=Maribacter sp. 2304DJ31-5 TaxID=3386273 RepID=UPI0039BCCE25
MKVISTNIGTATTVTWNGAEERTGIFKYPANEPLFLGKTDVKGDTVIDRVHHAGIHKACYLYSSGNYDYWKGKYPHLDWDWGMFGENLTIEGLDESVMRIGDIYKIGTALIQVSQPREPCYKLGIRFGTQEILGQFIDHNRSGTYVRVLEEGHIQKGDNVQLIEQSTNPLTVQQFFELMFVREKPRDTLDLFMANEAVPQYKKERYKKYLK